MLGSLVPRFRQVYALAPSNLTTGGPELIHQLVHEIRSLGGAAAVHYVPTPEAEIPDAYRHYDVTVSREPSWAKGDAVVYPETMLRRMPLLSRATPIVWWQSYDNAVDTVSPAWRQLVSRTFKLSVCHAQRVSSCRHVFQSHYARRKLSRWGVRGEMLSDYVVSEPKRFSNASRRPIICYNPKKGFEITQQIIAANSDLEFVAIQGMTKSQVLALLESAMVYVDFGNHPGKDRLPREAALRGAVVLVGRRGSADNPIDVPLDDQYKLSLDSSVVTRASEQIRSILQQFSQHQQMQACFRAALYGERDVFRAQVMAMFFRSNGHVVSLSTKANEAATT